MRFSKNICPRFQKAVDILGRRWTGLIVQALTEGPLRFSELTERLEVVSERMLSERLKELEREGIVQRTVIPDTPVRVEYALSSKGKALRGVTAAIEGWAERWVDVASAPKAKVTSKRGAKK